MGELGGGGVGWAGNIFFCHGRTETDYLSRASQRARGATKKYFQNMCSAPSVAVSHVDITAELNELFNNVTPMTADCILHRCQCRLATQVAFQHLKYSALKFRGNASE